MSTYQSLERPSRIARQSVVLFCRDCGSRFEKQECVSDNCPWCNSTDTREYVDHGHTEP